MATIEVKGQFKLDEGKQLPGGQGYSEEFTDHYFDTSTYLLTKQNQWLRLRDKSWTLKIVHNNPNPQVPTKIECLFGEDDIARRLGVTQNGTDLILALAESGYLPFAELEIYRASWWATDDFILTRDTVYTVLDEFRYHALYISLLVESEEERFIAAERIIAFAQSIGLSTAPVRSKLIEYLRLFRPDHFAFLVAQGVISPELAV